MSITLLNQINWFANAEDENVLSSLGVRFGFLGKGHESFPCFHTKQVHGTTIVEADTSTSPHSSERPHADAIYTQDASVLGVKTADCLPILFCSEKKTTVMALHGGWRGLGAGVVEEGVQKMREQSPGEAIFACIGPAIAHCHYEVGPELVDLMQKQLKPEQLAYCLSRGVGDRWFLDLQTLGTFSLLNSGIQAIHLSIFRSCTFCFPEKWHSFRRDASHSIRNWSWIQIPNV